MFKAILVVLCFLVFFTHQKITVNTTDYYLKDEYGRVVIMHGVNVMNEEPPYIPNIDATSFNFNDSLVAEDFINMREWGIKFIRLYVSWEAAEPKKTKYDETYLQQLVKIIKEAGKYDIQVILVVHQDLLTRQFCGRGFPTWAFEHHDFPEPVPYTIEYDADTMIPNAQDCQKYPKGPLYGSKDIIKGFSDLFTNKRGLHTAFSNLWKTIVKKVYKEPNVLGYEIMNEIFEDNNFYQEGELSWSQLEGAQFVNEENFLKLLEVVHNKIREIDNERLIIFPPFFEYIGNTTLLNGPGGIAYENRNVYSYPLYCTLAPGKDYHEDLDGYNCKGRDVVISNRDINEKLKLGNAAICTEFGGTSADHRKHDKEIDFMLSEIDSRFHWRAFFQYKLFNQTSNRHSMVESLYSLNSTHDDMILEIARPYALRICGVPSRYHWNENLKEMFLKFEVGKCLNQTTEFFINEKLYYPDGFELNTRKCRGCELIKKNDYHEYILKFNDPAMFAGRKVEVIVTPKKKISKIDLQIKKKKKKQGKLLKRQQQKNNKKQQFKQNVAHLIALTLKFCLFCILFFCQKNKNIFLTTWLNQHINNKLKKNCLWFFAQQQIFLEQTMGMQLILKQQKLNQLLEIFLFCFFNH